MAMIETTVKENKVDDLRVAAAVSDKIYHWVVLPSVLAMMPLTGTGLDASAENAGLVFKDSELRSLYPPRFPLAIPNYYSGKFWIALAIFATTISSWLVRCSLSCCLLFTYFVHPSIVALSDHFSDVEAVC